MVLREEIRVAGRHDKHWRSGAAKSKASTSTSLGGTSGPVLLHPSHMYLEWQPWDELIPLCSQSLFHMHQRNCSVDDSIFHFCVGQHSLLNIHSFVAASVCVTVSCQYVLSKVNKPFSRPLYQQQIRHKKRRI